MTYTVKVEGVEFDCEVDWDTDGRLESVRVFLPGSEVELSSVLDEKVLKEIDEQIYKEGQNEPDYEPDEAN